MALLKTPPFFLSQEGAICLFHCVDGMAWIFPNAPLGCALRPAPKRSKVGVAFRELVAWRDIQGLVHGKAASPSFLRAP